MPISDQPVKSYKANLRSWVLTARRKHRQVDPHRCTAGRHVQRPDQIAGQRLLPVILAPVDIRSAGDARTVEDMGWRDAFELFLHRIAVFHPYGRRMHDSSVTAEECLEVAGHPAAATPDEEDMVFGGVDAWHCCLLSDDAVHGGGQLGSYA